MKKSVVSKEYTNLQKEIIKLQEQWKQVLNPDVIQPKLDQAALASGVPAAALTAIDFDIPLFIQWIDEINRLIVKKNPELEGKLGKVRELLNEEVAIRWIDEAFAVNQFYFQQFAQEHELEGWMAPFLAETALRPYLQLVAEKLQPEITHAVHGAGCPVCGEPVRLAQLEENGKKVVHCPRCLVQWPEKRVVCSHCGNEDSKTIQFISVEGDATSQLQVCDQCHGYLKVIDTRQFISKPSSAILDLNSIHLDFIAQDNGYGAATDQNTAN
ncbi:formate dehydrogenase accessory protein FdhE [Mesobacillus maritimus]|uniref:formate dehydrogenase accessory protein FdhE n=1 Tax=Mesobacillus maritimus TaxID=1643336 RepID=UPI002041A32E|nr:formate dehydrogenase accessory protein FdhE [Mesobacillus maritimus]MCM3586812.1 formate dehydrogenase accessory protein FdhE [Mesobacillus maritimus]MCM3668833.1 formate dehydrogenase accessory protein FdhE [Mesobacillus maritimus]